MHKKSSNAMINQRKARCFQFHTTNRCGYDAKRFLDTLNKTLVSSSLSHFRAELKFEYDWIHFTNNFSSRLQSESN